MSLVLPVAQKPLAQLLHALFKRCFEGDARSLTDLQAAYLPGQDDDSALAFVRGLEKTLVQAGLQQWDVDALEKHLSEAGMGQEGQDLFVSYWRLEKDKVREALYQLSVPDETLASLPWRVDLKSSSRDQPELHEPAVILQLNTKGDADSVPESFAVELSKAEVATTLATLREIQRAMAQIESSTKR